MNRNLLLALVSAVLAAVAAHADRPQASQPARRFQQNRQLIQALVASGLRLARQTEPLERAQTCRATASLLADEIDQAARQRQTDRTAELGRHFGTLLRGVAFNLRAAGRQIPPGSADEPSLLQVGDEVQKLARPVEQHLAQVQQLSSDRRDLQQALDAVAGGRREVQHALADRIPPAPRKP
jgi:hypothetical protein